MDSFKSKLVNAMIGKAGFGFFDSRLNHDHRAANHKTNQFENIPNTGIGGLKMMISKPKKDPQNINFEGLFMSNIYVQGAISDFGIANLLELFGVPKGIRTPVAGVKGRCPGPG